MKIKRGDTSPALRITLYDGETVVDLTAATQVRVIGSGASAFSGPVTVDDPASGVVVRPWQTADTDTAGRIHVEVEVTWNDGTVQTFPPDSYNVVDVIPDLG